MGATKTAHPGPDCFCDWCNITDGAPIEQSPIHIVGMPGVTTRRVQSTSDDVYENVYVNGEPIGAVVYTSRPLRTGWTLHGWRIVGRGGPAMFERKDAIRQLIDHGTTP